MDLIDIAKRFAEGLSFVDKTTMAVTLPRKKTDPPYHPGVAAMFEDVVAEEVMVWWIKTYPNDFSPKYAHELQVVYPDIPRASCDFVFSSDGSWTPNPEWAIEVKRIQLIGNNGNNNDYGTAKVLSPYLKDRSLIHDLKRQQEHSFARHHACVGYIFSYSFATLTEAQLHHPTKEIELANLRKVLFHNEKIQGILDGAELVDTANTIFTNLDLVVGDVITQPFKELWRHPCGGHGLVFAWEVKIK